MATRISNRDLEVLSAYLDGEISADQKRTLEARLKSEEQLNRAYTELRRTRMILRSAPRLRAPRNFTLTQRMVGVRPTRDWSFPVLSMASVMATFLFILVFLGDRYITRQLQPAALMAAQSATTETFDFEASPEGTAQPLIESIPPETESNKEAGKSKLTAPLPTPEEPAAELGALQVTPEMAPSSRDLQLGAAPPEGGYPSPLGEIGPGERVPGMEIQRTGSGVFYLRLAEILLILVALASGTAAVLIYRKQRI